MIENHREKESYIWLVLIAALAMFAIFSAGFDHDVVFYGVFFMSIFVGVNILYSKEGLEFNRISIFFLLFILWALISLFWSISPIRTVVESIQLISFLLVYLLARKLKREGLNKRIKVLFIVAGGIALLGFLEYLFVSGSRISATFTNPNPFGIYMVMMFFLALSMAIRIKSKTYSFLSILFLSLVLLSGSRASMGAMVVALIIPFFGMGRSELKSAIIKLLIIFISAFIFSQISIYASIYIRKNVFIDKSLLDSITRSSSFVASSLKARLEFWRVAFDLFKNKPITGYGQGTFFSAYYIEYGMNEWYSRFTHNHYLQIMSELGIVGILLFLGILWTGLKGLIYNAKQKTKPLFFWGMVAGLLAFLLHIGVDFTWNFPAVTALFFFFLGVTTKEGKKPPLKLNKTISLIALVVIMLLTSWQFGSTKLYMKALNLEQESIDSALSITGKVNCLYPISSFGWSYESDLLYDKYMQVNDSTYLENSFTAMERALNNAPYDSGINTKLAKLYQNTGDYENAEKYYLIANRYSAYLLNSYTELGNMYLGLGEKEKAEEILILALEKSPFAIKRAPKDSKEATVDSVAIIHLTLANLYNEAGEKEKVQEQVNKVIELKEEYPFLEKYFK